MLWLHSAVVALAIGGGPGETVLLDFGATWCEPCRRMEPVIRQLEAQGYPIRRVDLDRQREVAARYGVDQVPTFIMLAQGREVDRQVGSTDIGRLVAMYRKARPVPSGGSASAPRVALNGGVGDVRPGSPGHSGVRADPVPVSEPASQPGAKPPPVGGTAGAGKAVSEKALIAVSVRIRIEERDGHSCGSGTIIDARGGEALILTCGHIFRQSGGKGTISVDLFGPTPATEVPGRLLWYDDDRPDVGLVAIRTPGPVVSARVAPADYRVRRGDRVYTVGCSRGQPPSVRRSRVTSLDRYVGPPNIQVAGLPVQGRSGGGLFSADGLVIGVCNAADPSENEGLYAGLDSIHTQLAAANLSFVFQAEGIGSADCSAALAKGPPAMPETMPAAGEPGPEPEGDLQARGDLPDSGGRGSRQELTAEQQAALDEILRWAGEGAEVICVVRPLGDPARPSEIITFNHASPAFLEQLAAEAAQGARRRVPASGRDTAPAGHIPTGLHETRFSPPPTREARGITQVLPPQNPSDSAWQPCWLDMGRLQTGAPRGGGDPGGVPARSGQ